VLETPHVIVGAAIAARVSNPFLAIPLAFLSHFALELVPHWNPHINTEIKTHGHITKESMRVMYFDSFLALASGTFLSFAAPSPHGPIVSLIACFASVLPDVIEAPYFLFHYKHKFLLMWLRFQKSLQNDADPLPGLLTQGAFSMAALWWMFFPR
jgi:hypothetical protein